MTRWRVAAAWALCMGTLGAWGQGGGVYHPENSQPGGTVTGHVVCEDTQRAARFARVGLVPAHQDEATRRGPFRGQEGGNARTDADGNFRIEHVAPGDYYVQATLLGYLSLRQVMTEEVVAGMSADDILARLPLVHVEANGGVSSTVTLERGASVSGEVLWADGTPVVGVNVASAALTQVQLPQALSSVPMMGVGLFAMTDDRGRFRLSGIAPGDTVVVANIMGAQASGASEAAGDLRVYPPGVFRRKDSPVMTLHRGDEREDVRIVVDVSRLHTVSGHVSAPPGSGMLFGNVQITDPGDSTLHLNGMVSQDGTFVVAFVPPGNYTMLVNGSLGRTAGPGHGVVQTLQPYQGSVQVNDTDVSGLAITLMPPGTASGSPAH